MSYQHTDKTHAAPTGEAAQKRRYQAPQLIRHGKVGDLTQAGTKGLSEGSGTSTSRKSSERRVKENIVRVGTHPQGFGLYLFDYLPEFQAQWGEGRQFGVMIDEVEAAVPEAVSLHADGYKRVDYAMLGIERTVH